ncbi:xylulokinase [Streptomyces shenzhenensis]|uniref:xylulokinase n=1 Tax=Streptomyces shenzhenensis TaxID=943815 RepID=UPI0034069479
MSRRLVAGVDSSTQSCKVELRHADDGRLAGTGSAPHPAAVPPASEQDPRAWWTALVTAFRAAMRDAGAGPTEVVAISVAAQCHGLVVLDADDQVIRPAKLWNDTTSTPEMLELRARIGDKALIAATGSLPTAAFTLGKVAWLARHEPRSFERVRRMLLPHDYLTFRLTGNAVTDRSEASGTAYFDSAANRYLTHHLDLITAADWLPMLPAVLGPDESAGTVDTDALTALGLQGDVLVGAGGGDQHAAALGLGMRPGDLMYSFGTSGVVMGVSEAPVHDLDGMVDGVADMTAGYVPLVSTLNAAKVSDTFARLLGVDHHELSRLALDAPPDTPRPALAAFLDGERKPDRPTAQGLLSGLTSHTSREQLARAAYEGVVFGLYSGRRHLERCGVPTDGRVIAVGGGARSAAYTQILADTGRRPVLLADTDEATARGAAVQAAAVAGAAEVTAVRDAWAPSTRTAAEPGVFPELAWQAYQATAAVTALDAP